MFVLEVRSSTTKGSINKGGHYQEDVVGLEAHVKDEARFPNKWAFFDLGTSAPSAKPLAANSRCQTCHAKSAAVDDTFVQFYPTLIPVAKAKHVQVDGRSRRQWAVSSAGGRAHRRSGDSHRENANHERSRDEHQHEDGATNALDVADAHVRDNGSHEVEHEADSRRDSERRPPDARHQPERAGELTGGQQRKVLSGTPTVSWIPFT